jgi:hypothetical protein
VYAPWVVSAIVVPLAHLHPGYLPGSLRKGPFIRRHVSAGDRLRSAFASNQLICGHLAHIQHHHQKLPGVTWGDFHNMHENFQLEKRGYLSSRAGGALLLFTLDAHQVPKSQGLHIG